MASSFAHRLRDEAPRWVRDGLISAQQAEAILARYPAPASWFSRPIAIFSVLGGALLVCAVALLVAHNWQEIPRWAKLGAVVTPMLAAHAAGLSLRTHGHERLSAGLFALGGGVLLVGIALIGQLLLLPAGYVLPSVALVVLGWLGAAAWYLALLVARPRCAGRPRCWERFYVPEGAGTVPRGKLEAEVALTESGRAFFTRLLVDGRPYP